MNKKLWEMEIAEKLKFYKLTEKDCCFDIPANTHIRYYENIGGIKIFKNGGFLKDKNFNKGWLTLSVYYNGNPQTYFEINIDKCEIYRKIWLDELYVKYKNIKNEYKLKIQENEELKQVRTEFDKLKIKYEKLKQKYLSANSENKLNTSQIN